MSVGDYQLDPPSCNSRRRATERGSKEKDTNMLTVGDRFPEFKLTAAVSL